jgi:hypothetical protein
MTTLYTHLGIRVHFWMYLHLLLTRMTTIAQYSVRACTLYCTEADFVKFLRGPGIDFKESISPAYVGLSYRPARLHRLAESIPGLLKRLQIQALNEF